MCSSTTNSGRQFGLWPILREMAAFKIKVEWSIPFSILLGVYRDTGDKVVQVTMLYHFSAICQPEVAENIQTRGH